MTVLPSGPQTEQSQQRVLAVMKTNRILDCISTTTASRSRDMIIALYSAHMKPHLEHCVQFVLSPNKRETEESQVKGH